MSRIEDQPVFVTSNTSLTVGQPGTYIVATTAAVATVTLPTRSPSPLNGVRKASPNAYRIVVLSNAKPATVTRSGTDVIGVNGSITATSFTLMPGQSVEIVDDGLKWVPMFGTLAPAVFQRVVIDSTTAKTLDRSGSVFVFTGSSAPTWTLPALLDTTGLTYKIKNRGSATITLQRAGSDQLYDTAAVTSITIAAGAKAEIINDGTYWLVV